MPRSPRSDLAPFSDWLRVNQPMADTSRNTYVSMVRAVLTHADLTEESILRYVDSRSGSTASTTRTAWRLFTVFCAERGLSVPNPFRGVGVRPNSPAFNLLDVIQERELAMARGEITAMPADASDTAVARSILPVPHSTKPEGTTLPEDLRVLLRNWIRPMVGEIQKVAHKLSWKYTYYDDKRGVWQTAHPTVRHGWINMPEKLVHALAVWTHGSTEKPEDGPLIPSQPGGSEPFPTLLLLRQIEV